MSGLRGRHEMPDQHHATRLQPRIHFGARETTLGFLGAEQGAGAVNGRIERRPGGLAVAIAPSGRAAIALLFAAPAAVAGYHAAQGLAQIGVPAEVWQKTFAVIGAIAVGGTAWARMALSIPPDTGPGDGAGFKSPFSGASAAKDS